MAVQITQVYIRDKNSTTNNSQHSKFYSSLSIKVTRGSLPQFQQSSSRSQLLCHMEDLSFIGKIDFCFLKNRILFVISSSLCGGWISSDRRSTGWELKVYVGFALPCLVLLIVGQLRSTYYLPLAINVSQGGHFFLGFFILVCQPLLFFPLYEPENLGPLFLKFGGRQRQRLQQLVKAAVRRFPRCVVLFAQASLGSLGPSTHATYIQRKDTYIRMHIFYQGWKKTSIKDKSSRHPLMQNKSKCDTIIVLKSKVLNSHFC